MHILEWKRMNIKISLKFVPKGPTNNIAARRQSIIWTNDGLVYWRIYASLGLSELTPYKTNFYSYI